MGETKSEQLVDVLDAFLTSSADLEAAAVVSFDGLTMASALPDEMDDDRVGAMSAALLSLGEQAARGFGRGDLQQLVVEADNGFVFLMSAQDQAVLVAITSRAAKMGFILFEMRRAAWDVGSVLEGAQAHGDHGDHGDPDDHDPLEAEEPQGQVALVAADGSGGLSALPTIGDDATGQAPLGVRGPFGDADLDDPRYVSANGREGADTQDRV